MNTASVAATFFPAAYTHGLILYEACGGMCAGLEMVLRNGISVTQYLYSDVDPTAQRIAAHRIKLLQAAYPHLLSPEALSGCFQQLPQDIRQVNQTHLRDCVGRRDGQWLVVAGWPWQDLSQAGNSAGITGERSRLLRDVVRIVSTLQHLMPAGPPAYLIENVPF